MKTETSGRNIFSLLFHFAPNRMFAAVILDALGGIAFALIIPLILAAVGSSEEDFQTVDTGIVRYFGVEVANANFATLFFSSVLFILATKVTSRLLLERATSSVLAKMRIELYERIVDAPVFSVEKTGPGRVMAVLVEDVPWLIASARLFPAMLSNLATLIGMLGYICYLSPHAFLFVIKALAVGCITYQIPIFIGLRLAQRRRDYADNLQKSVRALLDGFKELKLDRRKREMFLREYLLRNEFGVRDSDKSSQVVSTLAGGYGDMICFIVIGVMTFTFVNYHAISTKDLIATIMTLLYITAPIAGILQGLPQYINAGVSLRHVNRLFSSLPKETARIDSVDPSPWDAIHLEGIVYAYGEDVASYVIGPLSLSIRKGEITFIVGGNGSGKSTLSKLLTLHYRPQQGVIRFGDVTVDDDTLNAYRQQVGFIYSDYYLFETLLGFSDDELTTARVSDYLEELGLAGKVTFDKGRFSTLDLSDGQRRRLALLVAFIEDKDIYLFDEWAADQDPAFKNVFYHRLLGDLKRMGKAVIVVSHDDRYFPVADRIVYMEDGKITDVSSRSH